MAKKEQKLYLSTEQSMTVDEAKDFRASLYKTPITKLNEKQKREQFRIFWAKSRKKYKSRTKDIEKILWLHLLATKHDEPENFEKGLQHFGLKKIG